MLGRLRYFKFNRKGLLRRSFFGQTQRRLPQGQKIRHKANKKKHCLSKTTSWVNQTWKENHVRIPLWLHRQIKISFSRRQLLLYRHGTSRTRRCLHLSASEIRKNASFQIKQRKIYSFHIRLPSTCPRVHSLEKNHIQRCKTWKLTHFYWWLHQTIGFWTSPINEFRRRNNE